ncbi:MAG: hypothetical protein GY828_08735, partial [Candidatus Gracilibacteria bacterium]|nr:hypothetical protein [Candidatus Gracilibacteria bacterium]
EQYTKKAFAFLGCTFGNIKHTRIVDVLSHMLLAGERIWIEVPLRKDCTDRGNLELIETYKGYLLDEGKRNFLCQKMLEDGINIENGTLGLEVTPVESIGALLFTFIFTFNKKTEAMIGGKNIIFSPNRKIELLKIHRYTPEGLISYFEQQNFTLIDQEIKGFDGQFVFEKK